MTKKPNVITPIILTGFFAVFMAACARPLEWPDSPLYVFPEPNPAQPQPVDRQTAMEAIAGRYAHYDVVAYEDTSTKTPMRTLIMSYGFTEFYIRDGKLYQRDRFCFATQKINQPNVVSNFGDKAVQAIIPEDTEVELRFENGRWQLHRPESFTLLGVSGDPNRPLTGDPKDPAIFDADGDGKPGVTVNLTIGKVIKGEIYIVRREISANHLVLNSDGSITGYVVDTSEQLVVDANLGILRQPSNAVQYGGPGLNPIILVPVDASVSTCEDLRKQRDSLFPPEPDFRRPGR